MISFRMLNHPPFVSRATSLETLEVTNFRAASVLAHPKVIEWSRCLEEVQV